MGPSVADLDPASPDEKNSAVAHRDVNQEDPVGQEFHWAEGQRHAVYRRQVGRLREQVVGPQALHRSRAARQAVGLPALEGCRL